VAAGDEERTARGLARGHVGGKVPLSPHAVFGDPGPVIEVQQVRRRGAAVNRPGDSSAHSPSPARSRGGQERESREDIHQPTRSGGADLAGVKASTLATLCAESIHATVEDTSASLDSGPDDFGDEIAQLVDGVTKLHRELLKSPCERGGRRTTAKMMVAMEPTSG